MVFDILVWGCLKVILTPLFCWCFFVVLSYCRWFLVVFKVLVCSCGFFRNIWESLTFIKVTVFYMDLNSSEMDYQLLEMY